MPKATQDTALQAKIAAALNKADPEEGQKLTSRLEVNYIVSTRLHKAAEAEESPDAAMSRENQQSQLALQQFNLRENEKARNQCNTDLVKYFNETLILKGLDPMTPIAQHAVALQVKNLNDAAQIKAVHHVAEERVAGIYKDNDALKRSVTPKETAITRSELQLAAEKAELRSPHLAAALDEASGQMALIAQNLTFSYKHARSGQNDTLSAQKEQARSKRDIVHLNEEAATLLKDALRNNQVNPDTSAAGGFIRVFTQTINEKASGETDALAAQQAKSAMHISSGMHVDHPSQELHPNVPRAAGPVQRRQPQ